MSNKYNINDTVYYLDNNGAVEAFVVGIKLSPSDVIVYELLPDIGGNAVFKDEPEIKTNPKLLKEIGVNDDIFWFKLPEKKIIKSKVISVNGTDLEVYGGFLVSIEDAYKKEKDLIDSLRGWK